MKLNYTTNFQFRALYSKATPTLPHQASPTMYLGDIFFCIKFLTLSHTETQTAIYMDKQNTMQCFLRQKKIRRHSVLVSLCPNSDVWVYISVWEHVMCVQNVVKSVLLLWNQASVWGADFDFACLRAVSTCQGRWVSLCWTPSGVTGEQRTLQNQNGVLMYHGHSHTKQIWDGVHCSKMLQISPSCVLSLREDLLILTLSDWICHKLQSCCLIF